MLALALSVGIVLVVSAFCSLSEASIYAVRRPYIRQLAAAGNRAGVVLDGFKDNMERPITAILVINTVANTAGAAVAGALAAELLGQGRLIWFSVAFTLAVLFVSEIVPKVLGVVYSRGIAKAVALPWALLVWLLAPMTWLVGRFSHWLKPNEPVMAAPEDEVRQLAQMSAEEGSILALEATLVENALRLNEVKAREIMTPRPVVFRLSADMTVGELAQRVDKWQFSRIPIHAPGDKEQWTGVVRSADVLMALAQDRFDTRLKDLSGALHFVPDSLPGHELLQQFLDKRTHLFAVVDEFGGMAGVATLEDVLESLIGEEIVDEVDQSEDLREVARRRVRRGLRGSGSDAS